VNSYINTRNIANLGEEGLMKIFRSLLQFGLLSFVVGCCAGASLPTNVGPPKIAPPLAELNDRPKRVEFMNEATVALVTPVSDSFFIVSCTGVWISKGLILTAAHCVDEKDVSTYNYTSKKDFESLKFRTAILAAKNEEHDLALLITDPKDRPEHQIAQIEQNTAPVAGDPVDTVGHPIGYTWTYSTGFVSAVRENVKGPSTTEMKILQVSAPIWMGNSGGGAFNKDGHLIGICSWISKSGPQLAFFVHVDEIRSFLRREMLKTLP